MVIGNNMMKQEEGYVSDMCNGAVSMEVRIQARNLLSRFEYLFCLAKNLELLGGCQRKSVHRDHPWDHDFQRGTLLDPRRYAARAQDMQEATRRRLTHRTQLTFLAALETMQEMGIRWGQERGATDTLRRPESSKKKKWELSELPALPLLLKISLVS